MRLYTVLLFSFIFSNYLYSQQLVINEIMAKNGTTLQDEDGDYSDWIEIYNNGNVAVNLENYSLSDDDEELDKWSFPTVIVQPGAFLLVFASDKDRGNTDELHANFKISTSGETLTLSDDLGRLIDQVPAIGLSEDQSFARVPDGSSNWLITNIFSPGASNNSGQLLSFSHDNGFYTEPFLLTISSPLEDDIFYTFNGDTPSPSSQQYNGALRIDNPTAEENIFAEIPSSAEQNLISYKAWESPNFNVHKARIIRFASYNDGVRTSPVITKTFFVDSDMSSKYTIPVISLVTEGKHFFAADSGIYVPGFHYQQDEPEWTGNYFMKGREWERPIHVTYFTPKGEVGFSQDAGVRIHGGKTRQAAQKSLRLYARESYGKKYFNYKLLPNRDNEDYKRILLRTPIGAWGNKQCMFQDEFAHNVSRHLDMDYQDFQPAFVYLNGEYWGLHTIRDRIDEHYIEYTHDVDNDSVSIRGWSTGHYANMLRYMEDNDLAIQEHYEYIKTQMDVNNYMDYHIAEQFFANRDWPANNNDSWRKIPDGKWRWLLYDLDGGLYKPDYNMLEHATKNDPNSSGPNPPWSTFIFRNLLKNDEFKSNFINRYTEVLNTHFHIDTLTNRLIAIRDLYEPEVLQQSLRWNYPENIASWEQGINPGILGFLEERPCFVKENILSFFDLDDIDFTCVTNTQDPALLDMQITPNPSNGIFTITNHGTSSSLINLLIFNTNGQLIHQSNNINIGQSSSQVFDLTHHVSGTYFLQLVGNNKVFQEKIIIIK